LLKASGFKLKTVVCVELSPNTFLRMYFNIKYNTECTFHGYNMAVYSETRRINLYFGQGSTSDSIYMSGNGPEKKSYSMPGDTFDNIYKNLLEMKKSTSVK
jgi:hypothetical protein